MVKSKNGLVAKDDILPVNENKDNPQTKDISDVKVKRKTRAKKIKSPTNHRHKAGDSNEQIPASDSAETMIDDNKTLSTVVDSLDLLKDKVEFTSGSSLGETNLLYQLSWRWADFTLEIQSPAMETIDPPAMIDAEPIGDTTEIEFVYTIQDFGNKMSTSKGEDLFTAGFSMCKLYFTIEKMIALLMNRLISSGVDIQQEVQVLFFGHELAQRKAFESIINLNYNVMVSNFDPGGWGERYLDVVKELAARGYGYPASAPRTVYQQSYGPHGAKPTK